MRSMHVPDMWEFLLGMYVSKEIGYADDNNGRRAIKRHVPQKYMMRFGETRSIGRATRRFNLVKRTWHLLFFLKL